MLREEILCGIREMPEWLSNQVNNYDEQLGVNFARLLISGDICQCVLCSSLIQEKKNKKLFSSFH
jgi:hypothetical protein